MVDQIDSASYFIGESLLRAEGELAHFFVLIAEKFYGVPTTF